MADVVRVSITGDLPGGEVWSVNPVWQVSDSGAPVTYEQVNAAALAISAITIPTPLRTLMNSNTRITGCRVEARNYDDTLVAQAEAAVASPVGGSGSNNHPYQTSVVTSLRTAFPGGQGRGRLYWPGTGISLQASNLRLSAADVTSHLGGVKSYLSQIETAVEAQIPLIGLVVWSRAGGISHQVNRVLMGDVADVQRRRRDTLTENYTTTAWP